MLSTFTAAVDLQPDATAARLLVGVEPLARVGQLEQWRR